MRPIPKPSIPPALTLLLSLACLWAIWVLPVAHGPRALAQTPAQQAEAERLAEECYQLFTESNYQQTLDVCTQAVEVARAVGDRLRESASLNNLGIVYESLGQYSKVIDYYEQSLRLARDLGSRQGESASLNNLGAVYGSLGQYSKAIDYYEQSLHLDRDLGFRQGESISLTGLGTVYESLGQYSKAIDYYEQSLRLARDLGDRQGEANSLRGLGNVYESLGQYSKAIDYYKQSLHLDRDLGFRQGESISLMNLGDAYYSLGELSKAEPYLRQAIEILESLRANLPDADRLSFFETLTSPYYTLQWLLAAQERYDEALEIAERGRARAFVELLAQRLAPEEAESLADSQIATPLTLDQIKQVARDQNATLVEYSIAAADQLYIWVVAPSGAITFRWVDLSTLNAALGDLVSQANTATAQGQSDGALSLLVQGTRSALGTVDAPRADSDLPTPLPDIAPDDPRFDDGLQQLYHLLIDPIQDLLPTQPQAHVVFIPQGSLYLAPFAALQAPDGTYLIEHHTLRTAPSIQVLHLTRQQRQARQRAIQQALVVGNPYHPDPKRDLPAAAQEARVIARVFQTSPLLGHQATLSAVKERMPEADLIHLATHAAPNVVGESYGGLIELAHTDTGERILTASDILSMQLQAELVVLSGCNTGLSDIINSDGVVGLARSIMTAGTPSVIMSLWQVPDAPTAFLMQRFYHYWHPSSGLWSRLAWGVGLAGALALGGYGLGQWRRQSWRWPTLPRLHPSKWRWKGWRKRLGMYGQNGRRWLWIVGQGWLFSARAWRRQWRWQWAQLRRGQWHRVRWQALAGATGVRLRQGLPVGGLTRRWLLVGVVVGVALVAVALQAAPAPQAGLDKAQALRQAMLTTMKTHPAPRDWAAFTLMGEAE